MEERFRSLMEDAGLSEYTDDILKLSKNSIRIATLETSENDLGIGQSKIGGSPDLPHGIEWPTWIPPAKLLKRGLINKLFSRHKEETQEIHPSCLAFIAQINLAEVSSYDSEKQLPDSGILYFFCDVEQMPWGQESSHAGGWRTIYWNGDISQLKRTAAPDGLDVRYIYQAYKPAFTPEISFPSWESKSIEHSGISGDDADAYIEVLDNLHPDSDSSSRLLGYPDEIQGDMTIECQIATQGINKGQQNKQTDARERLKDLRKEPNTWQLLFQIDSANLDTNWGDAGCLYYWIKSEDLQQHNFENVWLIFQCY